MPYCVVYDDILNSENTDTLVVYIFIYITKQIPSAGVSLPKSMQTTQNGCD